MTQTHAPAIADIATVSSLLVISDFDGTLAGFSKDAYAVPIQQKSLKALKALSLMPDTTVVVLSGRHLEGLGRVLDVGDYPIITVGSHGAEDSSKPIELTPKDEEKLAHIEQQLAPLVEQYEGAFIEHKPFHRVLHSIRVSDPDAAAELLAAAEGIDTGDMKVTRGKSIIEYSVATATKGSWIAQAMRLYSPDAAVFFGDDTTDEHGFEELASYDSSLTVKVGEGETVAKHRVAGIDEVSDLLEELADARKSYIETRAF